MSEFLDFHYYPALRTRPAEMRGYTELSVGAKKKLLPFFTLGKWPRQSDLSESLRYVREASGNRPFILDLTRESIHATPDLTRLLQSSDDGFAAWREFVGSIENAIPVVQMTSDTKLPQIIRQASSLSRVGLRKIAFRVSDFRVDVPRIVSALSALDDPSQAVIFVDLGYVRDSMSASISAAISTINEIRAEIPEAIVCVLSTSFPASVTAFLEPASGGTRGVIPILERDLHYDIGADAVIYGDHGSIHARVYDAAGGQYTPRIDYPLVDAWIFERRPGKDSSGYVEAARALLERYPNIAEENTWGAAKIVEASHGRIDGMKTASAWIAARVNMHVQCQLDHSEAMLNASDDDDDGDDQF